MILRDTGLSARSYTEVISAFSIAYMIANPLWGAMLDFIGLRMGMLLAVALWTVASTAHAWMAGFAGFAAVRVLLGLGEGATFSRRLAGRHELAPAGPAIARPSGRLQRRISGRDPGSGRDCAYRAALRLARGVPVLRFSRCALARYVERRGDRAAKREVCAFSAAGGAHLWPGPSPPPPTTHPRRCHRRAPSAHRPEKQRQHGRARSGVRNGR